MDAEVGVEDLAAHVGDVLRSGLADLGVVVLDRFEQVPQLLRDDRPRKVGPALEGRKSLDRHDAGHDRDGDAGGAEAATPVDKDVGVVKHLGKDNVGSGVDFLLKVPDLGFLRLAVGVAFGEARDLRQVDNRFSPRLRGNV